MAYLSLTFVGRLHVQEFFRSGVEIGGVGGAYAPPTPPKFLVLRNCTAENVVHAIALLTFDRRGSFPARVVELLKT